MMKIRKNNRGILLLGWLLLQSACQKIDLPAVLGEDPVFSVEATIGGAAVQFTAGENDNYLFTEYRKDAEQVFSFVGRFEKLADCTSDCNEMLEFEIRDAQVNPGNSVDIARALRQGIFSFQGSDSSGIDSIVLRGFEVDFQNKSNANANLRYLWDFGDNTTSVSASPSHFYASPINQAPLVSLFVEDASSQNGCNSSVAKLLYLSDLHPFSVCHLNYQVQSSPASGTSICASMNGQPPFSFLWEIDTSYFTNCTPNLFFNDTLFVRLSAMDANGCTDEMEIVLQQDSIGNTRYCSAAFDYAVSEVYDILSGSDSLHLSQVTIRYRDSAGTFFQSAPGPGNNGDLFEIVEVSDFINNENGEKTQKLSIRFSCTLYAADGKALEVENGTGVIAVAYP